MPPDPTNNSGADADPERFWAEVLSESPQRIRAALLSLSEEEAAVVRAHLHRMATEEGWHPAQRQSARSALDLLEARGRPEA